MWAKQRTSNLREKRKKKPIVSEKRKEKNHRKVRTTMQNVKQQQLHQRTRCNPLVCANVPFVKYDYRTLARRFLDIGSTRDDEPDDLLDTTLNLHANRRTKRDARIDRDHLHRHVRPAMVVVVVVFRRSRGRGVRAGPVHVRVDVGHLRFGQECFWEGVEGQMGA